MDKKTGYVFCCFLLFHFACGSGGEELSTRQKAEIVEMGKSSAAVLMKDLKAHLMEALENNDIVEGFEACAAIAQPLTADVEEKLPQGVKIKRTSFKFRNPLNAPDEGEKEALQYFEKRFEEEGELPSNYIQAIEGNGEYRYYEPLTVAELCLRCHGDAEAFDPQVRESLAENYPDDKATGYKLGDFRGLTRVSIPASAVSEKE
jgi:hypothetical protein